VATPAGWAGTTTSLTWEEREVELITQVLCRVEDLPDQPVYAALVVVREAVKSGDKKRVLRATLGLTETFLECVREAYRIGIGESPWAVLARQEELGSWAERLEQRHLLRGWPDFAEEGQKMSASVLLRESCGQRRALLETKLTILL